MAHSLTHSLTHSFFCSDKNSNTVDPEFVRVCLEKKLFFKESFPKIMQSKAYPVVTRCISTELRQRGESYKSAAVVAKRLNHVKCSHLQRPVSSKECILSLLESHEYCVATQDEELKKKVNQQFVGIPLLHIVNNMIVLEPPSQTSKDFAKQVSFKYDQCEINNDLLFIFSFFFVSCLFVSLFVCLFVLFVLFV
jgi:rRNA-processing protein FCF1